MLSSSTKTLCNDRLHTPHFAVLKHHLDAVRMRRAVREYARDDALGQAAGALVLLLHDLHAQPRFDLIPFGYGHYDFGGGDVLSPSSCCPVISPSSPAATAMLRRATQVPKKIRRQTRPERRSTTFCSVCADAVSFQPPLGWDVWKSFVSSSNKPGYVILIPSIRAKGVI